MGFIVLPDKREEAVCSTRLEHLLHIIVFQPFFTKLFRNFFSSMGQINVGKDVGGHLAADTAVRVAPGLCLKFWE